MSTGVSARALRRSTTILQRPCWSLRRSVAARMLPRQAKPTDGPESESPGCIIPVAWARRSATCCSSKPLVTVGNHRSPEWTVAARTQRGPRDAVPSVADASWDSRPPRPATGMAAGRYKADISLRREERTSLVKQHQQPGDEIHSRRPGGLELGDRSCSALYCLARFVMSESVSKSIAQCHTHTVPPN